MKKRRLPNSIRKYIRKEKARIRREVLDSTKQEELIKGLYLKFNPGKVEKKTEEKKEIKKVIKKAEEEEKPKKQATPKKPEKPKKKKEKTAEKKPTKKDENK